MVASNALPVRPGDELDLRHAGARPADARLQRWRALGFPGRPTSHPPVPPDEVALRRQAAERTPSALAAATGGIHRENHAGMQLYISHQGVRQSEAAVGWATGDTAMTSRTLLPWFCAMKPLFVLGFGLLWEAGELDPWQPVSDVVAEFTGGRKDSLTFWHLLTHTSGLSPDPTYEALWGSRDEVLAAIWRAGLPDQAAPGAHAYYAQFWAWAVLSEAIQRRSGLPYAQFLRQEVLDPLGAHDCVIEMTDAVWADESHRIGPIYDTESDDAPRLFPGAAHRWQMAAHTPGSGGVGSAGALGRIAEALLPHPPRPLLRPQTTAAIRARHRVGMWDEHWSAFLSWGLGVVADGWLFGSRCSAATVGHVGYNTSFFCVDPVNEVVVAAIANGLCSHHTSADRDRGVTDGAYRDLGIAVAPPPPRIVAVDPPADLGEAAARARAEAQFWNPAYANPALDPEGRT
ncbi:MAG TPA: serine hydrolase domain-containing protein [Acidimicrobiales bacterium]|nr:serine hydrolase domain-containing protein [Acidimicrobiales bacterium]